MSKQEFIQSQVGVEIIKQRTLHLNKHTLRCIELSTLIQSDEQT